MLRGALRYRCRAWAVRVVWAVEHETTWEELTFDYILSRFQRESQKSWETGAELHNPTGAMNDIHDTLDGSLVSRSYIDIFGCS